MALSHHWSISGFLGVKQHYNNLDPTSQLGENTKGYWLWDCVTSKVLLHRDVIFNEHILFGTSVMLPPISSSLVIMLDSTTSFTNVFIPLVDLPTPPPLLSTSHSFSSSSHPEATPINDITPGEIRPETHVHPSPLTPMTLLSHPNY